MRRQTATEVQILRAARTAESIGISREPLSNFVYAVVGVLHDAGLTATRARVTRILTQGKGS